MNPEWEIALYYHIKHSYCTELKSWASWNIYICRHFRESIYLNVNPLKNIHPRNFPCLLFKWEEKKLQKNKANKKSKHKKHPLPPKKELCNSEREYFISYRTSAASGPPLRARAQQACILLGSLRFVRLCSQAWVPISERGFSAGKD